MTTKAPLYIHNTPTLPPLTQEQIDTLNHAAGIALHRDDTGTYALLRAMADGEKKYAADQALRDELESLGGTVAAKAGWDVLRAHNPKLDQSTGVEEGDVKTFDDLPMKMKLHYARFAKGVMDNLELRVDVHDASRTARVLIRHKNADTVSLIATFPTEVFNRG